jgi:hypothetical protein
MSKVGYTVKVKYGSYKDIEGLLIDEYTIRPFDQELYKKLYEESYEEYESPGNLWYFDETSYYSDLGGYISNEVIEEYEFYKSVPINPLTTLLYPEAEISSDGKFYYV